MALKSRRDEYSQKTKGALLGAARRLFATRGYAGTSLDEVVRAARVTKGALYHHFSGKEELLTEVLNELHRESMARVGAKAKQQAKPWDSLVAGIAAFLDSCSDPEFGRIALQDAPSVLGHERWSELDERHSSGMLRASLQKLIDAGEIESQPIDLLVRLVSGALHEAALYIASHPSPTRARADAGRLLERFLSSLRVQRRGR